MKRSRQRRRRIMRRGLWYSLALCLVIMLFGGAGFWLLEPGVASFTEGLWLAFTTAATVGYGDVVPQTQIGRVFAALMVLLGLSVLSLVTASLAAIFVEQEVEDEVHTEERLIEHELQREIRALREQVRALDERLNSPARAAQQPPEKSPL